MRPTHLGLNPNRRLSLPSSLLSPAEINEAGTRRHLYDSKFVSSRARAKRNARNYLLEISITRLLFAIRGVSRGANALWSHTARAKNSQHRAKRAGGLESNREREKSIIQKKKGKIHGNPRALNSGKKALNDDANIYND